MGVAYGGKLGIAAVVATQKWNFGGKRNDSAQFATRAELE